MFSNQGNSLRLRQTKPEDAQILFSAYQDEAFIRLYRSNNNPQSEEELTNILTERANYSPIEVGYVEFMIEHKQHGPIGVAVLSNYAASHKRAEFMIGLFEQKNRSLGYGTEATLLVLDLVFNVYKLHKIYSYVYDYNQFSHKNMLKFGFKHEGTLEEHHYMRRENRFIGLHINGITEARFRNHEKIRRYSWRLLGRDVTQAYKIIKLSSENQLPQETNKQFIENLRNASVNS